MCPYEHGAKVDNSFHTTKGKSIYFSGVKNILHSC